MIATVGAQESLFLILVILCLALLAFSIVFTLRAFKAFNATIQIDKKLDELIKLLSNKN